VIGYSNDVVVNFTQQSRRGFVGWHRYYHLYGKTPHFQYAPGTEWPFACHTRLFNAQINTTTFEIHADRTIAATDPILLECLNDALTVHVTLEDFPEVSIETLKRDALCLDLVELRKKGGGAHAKRPLPANLTIQSGQVLHMHRAEFYNETSRTLEPLLKYTYGHPDTDVLFLPNFAVVSSIRHGRPANVELQWYHDDPIEEILTNTSDILFGQYEFFFLWAHVVTLREIKPGEELLMDLGDAFEANRDVLQERAAPKDFFPDDWLKKEKRWLLASEMPMFATPKLEPGQVSPLTLADGETKLSGSLHRVGLPDTLADSMESFAEDIGLLAYLKRYVFDKPLPVDTSERVRFNNATWWTKRFDSVWASNMHYITTDDDKSNEQMFKALKRGGFDTVLAGIGQHFNLSKLTCYYPSYIVVNHCVRAHVHSDSDFPQAFNFIFPIVQVPNNSEPELILAADDGLSSYTPYRYERDAGVLLGKDGMHGTSPTDYRNDGGVRIVVSVYLGDFSDESVARGVVEDWHDPPYPNYHPGQLHHALTQRIHWSKDDPTASIGNPQLPRGEFSLLKP